MLVDQEFKQQVLDQLSAGPVVVTFTKKDGTERVMPCTTNPTVIMFKDQGNVAPYSLTSNAIDAKVASVYDLEANGWRSFRWDSVKTAVVNF
jgi:hypothetical protein